MRWTFAVGGTVPAGEPRPTPFSVESFGPLLRLVWPRGASQLNRRALATYWGRFALVVERQLWTLIDAERDDVRRLRVTGLHVPSALAGDGEHVWLRDWNGVLAIPTVQLEALAPGDHEVEISVTYPAHRPDVRRVAVVERIEGAYAHVTPHNGPAIMLEAAPYDLTAGAQIVLGGELAPNLYDYIEVIGQPRRAILRSHLPDKLAVACTREQLRDPAAGSRATMAPLEGEEVALLAQIADGDDVARGVLIDLLADRGEPDAATFALLRAGKPVTSQKRRAALGPLVHFFELEWDHGLPASATLVRHPPEDEASVAALLGDLRLGLITELAAGNGPPPFYVRLLASGALAGLRRVEAVSHEVLDVLRAHHAGVLTHLVRVPFPNQLALAMLADAAFASVIHVELSGLRVKLRPRLAACAAAFPVLPGRHVRLAPHPYHVDGDVARALFPRFAELELASLEIDGVAVVRDGDRIVARIPHGKVGPAVDAARAVATP